MPDWNGNIVAITRQMFAKARSEWQAASIAAALMWLWATPWHRAWEFAYEDGR